MMPGYETQIFQSENKLAAPVKATATGVEKMTRWPRNPRKRNFMKYVNTFITLGNNLKNISDSLKAV